jgi:hypothetical protein
MQKLISIKIHWAFFLYILFDIIATGMGMGVPIMNILFGFIVGWYIARRALLMGLSYRNLRRKILTWCILAACFTVLLMFIIWGPTVRMIFDPDADLANFGIPMILYEPLVSFIGWIISMVAISPFLQLLMSIFGAILTLITVPYIGKSVNENLAD